MSEQPAVRPAGLGVIVVIVAALAVAGAAIWLVDRGGENGNRLSDDFVYQIDQYKEIDRALIAYSEVAQFASGMIKPKAVAVGPDGQIHVAGDQTIRVFDGQGEEIRQFALDAAPSCLAVAPEEHSLAGSMLVGVGDHVEVYAADGSRTAIWPSLGEKTVLTSIAIDAEDVFVADAGKARVHRLSTDGELLGVIGDRNVKQGHMGFVVPSPFFDVAVHPDGWLRVVNPGALRVEAYSRDGTLELFWGDGGAAVERFFGCCNPANMVVLPDGRYVTAEKGLVRVKVFTADGQFESVVAGPNLFGGAAAAANASLSDHEHTAVDLAVDAEQRIVVLDLTTARIHIFEDNQAAAATEGERDQ